MKSIHTVLFLVLFLASIFAASTHADDQPIDWKAQWIWQPQDGPSNSWVAFRKDFDIKDVTESVTASIAADSKYWLWINGELVVFDGGSARGPSPHRPWHRVQQMFAGEQSKIEFAGEDENFIKLKIGSGQWKVIAAVN